MNAFANRCSLTSVLAVVLLLAGPAHAAAGGAEDPVKELLWQAFNLALLGTLIFLAARKPIRAFFAERHDQIKGEIDGASGLLSEAESRYAQWQRRLADLDAELDQVRTTARDRAQAEREKILTDAHAAADRIRADARAAVEQELRRARAELREEAADLAIELASRQLADQVNDTDRERLLDEFIDRVAGSAAGGPSGPRAS